MSLYILSTSTQWFHILPIFEFGTETFRLNYAKHLFWLTVRTPPDRHKFACIELALLIRRVFYLPFRLCWDIRHIRQRVACVRTQPLVYVAIRRERTVNVSIFLLRGHCRGGSGLLF